MSRANAAANCAAEGFSGLYSISTDEDRAQVTAVINAYVASSGLLGNVNFWFSAQLAGNSWINDDKTYFLPSAKPLSTDPSFPCLGGIFSTPTHHNPVPTLIFIAAKCATSVLSICEWITTDPTTTSNGSFF